ncbi:hypothetical protein N9W84_01020 [bacterium]|nr:hypothetical protein [bacterium]
MKKYLIRLADHLDKKGFRKEADYIDLVLGKASPSVVMGYKKESSYSTWDDSHLDAQDFSYESESREPVDVKGIYETVDIESLNSEKEIPKEIKEKMLLHAITEMAEEGTPSGKIKNLILDINFMVVQADSDKRHALQAIEKGWVSIYDESDTAYRLYKYEV